MFLEVIIVIISFLALASVFRAILGPTIWDRLLGFSLLSSKIVIIIILYALLHEKSFYLDIVIAFALLGFLGVVFISEFIQKRGKL